MNEDVRRVLGLLSQDETLRMLAAVTLTGRPADSGLPEPAARQALERLERGGLAEPHGDGWRVVGGRFRELLQAVPRPDEAVPADERVLRTFLVDGRLKEIPTRMEKRMVVLRHIAALFEPGVRYPEKDVDVTLRAFHDDYPALRRYLVESQLLSRENNVYWRSGGPVEV